MSFELDDHSPPNYAEPVNARQPSGFQNCQPQNVGPWSGFQTSRPWSAFQGDVVPQSVAPPAQEQQIATPSQQNIPQNNPVQYMNAFQGVPPQSNVGQWVNVPQGATVQNAFPPQFVAGQWNAVPQGGAVQWASIPQGATFQNAVPQYIADQWNVAPQNVGYQNGLQPTNCNNVQPTNVRPVANPSFVNAEPSFGDFHQALTNNMAEGGLNGPNADWAAGFGASAARESLGIGSHSAGRSFGNKAAQILISNGGNIAAFGYGAGLVLGKSTKNEATEGFISGTRSVLDTVGKAKIFGIGKQHGKNFIRTRNEHGVSDSGFLMNAITNAHFREGFVNGSTL